MIADGVRTLSWNNDNKLLAINAVAGGNLAAFLYGPDGSRIAKLAISGKCIYADADYEIEPDGVRRRNAGPSMFV